MRSFLAAIVLATACAAPNADVEAPRCGFRNARGPFAQGPRPTTAEPPSVQFEPEQDVIMKGQVPRVDVRIGDRGIGSYNKTTVFKVIKPDKTLSTGPCDPSRAPRTSSGFAALSFECHPLDQTGLYDVEFDPAAVGLQGESAQMTLRVVDVVPPAQATPAGWKSVSLATQPPNSRCGSRCAGTATLDRTCPRRRLRLRSR